MRKALMLRQEDVLRWWIEFITALTLTSPSLLDWSIVLKDRSFRFKGRLCELDLTQGPLDLT